MYENKNIEIKKRTKTKNVKEKKPRIKKERKSRNNKIHSVFQDIDWKAVILKLIILFSILFLIIFTISRIQDANTKKSGENNYNDNLTYLTNTLLNYYNTKKLPKKDGDSISMIFQEMLDFNIIKDLKPNENDTYDLKNSYIIVTKEADNFKLKIYLVWPNGELSLTQFMTCDNQKCSLKK